MDLKLRRLQFVRGFNNRQNDRDSGSLRTRPGPRTVPVHRNALPAPPTTSPGTQNGLTSLRRPDVISSPDFPSSHPFPFSRRPAHPTDSALDSRPEVRALFRQIPSPHRASPRSSFLL